MRVNPFEQAIRVDKERQSVWSFQAGQDVDVHSIRYLESGEQA